MADRRPSDAAEPPRSASLWSRLARLLGTHRNLALQAAGLALAGQVLALGTPWLAGTALDQALPHAAPGLLGSVCLGLALVALFRAVLGWIQETLLLVLSARLSSTLARDLLQHMLWLPFRYFENRSLGSLLQAHSGLAGLQSLILEAGLGALLNLLASTAILTYMILLLPGLTGLVAIAALGLALLTFVVGRQQAREQARAVEAAQSERTAVTELLAGMATLKATSALAWSFRRWAERLGQTLHFNLQTGRAGLWSELGDEGLNQALTLAILVLGGSKVLAGELTLGSLVTFTQLSAGFFGTFQALTQVALSLLAMRPAWAALERAFRTEPQSGAPAGNLEAAPRVVVEDAWFRYEPKSRWVLRRAALEVAPGTFHPLKGPSGSGKSTLLKLLAGLYVPDQGRIRLGGMDPARTQGIAAYLPQFPHLFNGSIGDNLKFLSGGASLARLQAVARDTGLAEWLDSLPMGAQTRVGPGGGNLSGGQRQLLAITAVLASSHRVLLLDESLRSLDWVSRARILGCPHFQERTVIYASHEEVLGPLNAANGTEPIHEPGLQRTIPGSWN